MASLERYAIYCGLMAPVVSLGTTGLSTVLAPASEFTWQAYALSDLGRPDARTRPVQYELDSSHRVTNPW